MAKVTWTEERYREVSNWRDENNATLTEVAEHFGGGSNSSYGQALNKYKKIYGTKRAYVKKNKSLTKPLQSFDLNIPDDRPTREPVVAVAFMPISALQELVGKWR